MHSSIRTRLLAAFLVIALSSAAGLSLYSLSELEGYALRKLEERLETEARVVSALLGVWYEDAERSGDATQAAAERLARTANQALVRVGPLVSSRIRVLDTGGTVAVDSGGAPGLGANYRERTEVRAALGGRYGAATRVAPDARVALYVAVPVMARGSVIGATYVSSTTFSIVTLLRGYRNRLIPLVLAYVLLALVVTEILARWLARPIAELEHGAAAFAAGDHSVRVEPAGARETRALAEQFNALADEVEHVVSELKDEELRKSRFVSDVSHELRTPLTAIRGAAETLMQTDVPDEDRLRFLATIVSEADRLARLANDLLTLQRLEGGTDELPVGAVDLTAIAHKAVAALEPVLAQRGVSVAIDGDAPSVLGDSDRLQQVVANLVDNASRATRRGGQVSIAVSTMVGRSLLAVADEGPGIADEDLTQVFERFYRSDASRDRSTGGAGLGLAIVKAIAIAHRGTVEVANRPEGGAVITVSIPSLG